MFWKQAFAWPLHQLREFLGVYRYTRPQRYRLAYRVLLSMKEAGLLTLAIPLPPDTEHQRVENLVIQLPDAKDTTDSVFGNRVLLTTLQAPVGQVEAPVFRCEVNALPYSPLLRAGWRVVPHGSTRGSSTTTGERGDSGGRPRDARVRDVAEQIGRGSCVRETARRINAYIVDHLVYGDPIDGLYSDIDALTRPRVDCGGFVSLFVSLCLAHEIPARIVSGFWLDGRKNEMHAWAEFQDEKGVWIPVDPSVEQMARQGRTHKSGRFGFVGSDRLTLSVGSPISIGWNNKIFYAPLLQHPFVLEGGDDVTCRGAIHVCAVS